MNVILLNLFFAIFLFIINIFLGNLQYFYRNIFEYEVFSFAPSSEGNYSGNFFQLIVNPSVFITIIAAFAQSKGNTEICINLWQTILYYWLLRLLVYIIKGRVRFINWVYEIVSFFISNLLGLLVIFGYVIPLIEREESIFISMETLRDAVWVAILFYLFKAIWDICKGALQAGRIYSDKKKERIVKLRYEKFYRIYDAHINEALRKFPIEEENMKELRKLIYAIMIYEDYNRPLFYRKIERFIKAIFPKKQRTLGIMQVMTRENITDLESVERACKKIAKDFIANIDDEPVEKVLNNYNMSEIYQNEVMSILYMLGE